jgi:hypothetical protein
VTNEAFLKARAEFTRERFKMCDEKAVGYTEGSDNRHYNFEVIGKDVGVEPERVMLVYLLKHWMAVKHYVKTGEQVGGGVKESLADIANYVDLLWARVVEKESAAE